MRKYSKTINPTIIHPNSPHLGSELMDVDNQLVFDQIKMSTLGDSSINYIVLRPHTFYQPIVHLIPIWALSSIETFSTQSVSAMLPELRFMPVLAYHSDKMRQTKATMRQMDKNTSKD
ncbi:MAG: hypothetical protein MHPSP_001574 [Paramarteilia canceri]